MEHAQKIQPPEKITGYINGSPPKKDNPKKKDSTMRVSEAAATVSSTADKSNPKKRKLNDMS